MKLYDIFFYKDTFTKLKNSVFIKNVFVVMSGTVIAQILGFSFTPIISRLFSPTDFGVFGSFNAVLSIISAMATLEYTQAIMLPKNKNDALNLFILSCLWTFFFSICCSIILLVFPTVMQSYLNYSNKWIGVLLFFGIFVYGINQAFQAWCVREKAFKYTSSSQIVRSLTTNLSQVSFGFLKGGPISLIFTSICGDFLATINFLPVVCKDLRSLRKNIKLKNIYKLAKEYRDFPIYSVSENVINTLSINLPILILSHYYGIAIVGAYTFSMKILSAPMGLILRALRQVMFQKIAETYNNNGNLMSLYMKTTLGLFFVALLPSFILLLFAPQIFTFIFGKKWLLAGQCASSLVLWLMFMFCNVPSVLFARVLRLQRKMFIYDQILLSLRALVLILGGEYLTPITTIWLFSISGALMNIIFICIIGYSVKEKGSMNNFKDILVDIR